MKRDKAYLTILYLLSPLMGLILSFKSKDRKIIKYSIALFSIWIGFTFSIASGSSGDVLRYQKDYKFFQQNYHSLEWLFDQLYITDGFSDIFSAFTTLIFANLGFSFEIYLGFLGLIFSLVYSKFVFQLLDLSGKLSYVKKMVFLFALLVIPIWYGINNIRFTLVTMIFVTSIYDLSIHKNRKKNFLMICLTPLIHFSVFWVPIVLIVVFNFSKFLNPKILLFSFVVMAVAPVNTIVMSSRLSNFIPTVYEDRSSSYVDIENISEKMEEISEISKSTNLHAKFLAWPYTSIFYILPIILGLTLIRTNEQLGQEDWLLLKWILFFGSIIALVGFLPSFGRFKAFVILPSILLLFRHWNLVLRSFRPVVLSIVFLMMLYSFVKLRTALDYFSVTTILGNPISLLFTDIESRTALIDVIK